MDEESSIFVCFMCEEEFGDVTALNQHIEKHYTEEEVKKPKSKQKTRKKEPPNQPSLTPATKPSRVVVRTCTTSKSLTKSEIKIEKNMDDDPAYRSAMRLKRIIQMQLKKSEKEGKKEPNNDLNQDLDPEFIEDVAPGIMMLDTHSINSKSLNSTKTNGPTIIVGDTNSCFGTPDEAPSRCKPKKSFARKPQPTKPLQNDPYSPYNKSDFMTTPPAKSKRGAKSKSYQFGDFIGYTDLDDPNGAISIEEDYEPPRKVRNTKRDDSYNHQMFTCDECGKEFRTVGTLRVHAKSHDVIRELNCPFCDKVFPQRHILHQHLVMDHEESHGLICSICQKVFTRRDTLRSHMLRMHEEEGGITCFVCNKNFPTQSQLEIHIRIHTGERPYKCQMCNKGFVQKAHLKTHLKTMHNAKEVNCTLCRICNKMFDGRAGLKDHVEDDHDLSMNEYKSEIARLRKEGRIPEIPPSRVNVVDPSFRYQKVDLSDIPKLPATSKSMQMLTNTSEGKRKNFSTSKRGRPAKGKPKTVGATIMNYDYDMFAPGNCNLDSPPTRDQEELNIVESAFKVMEQMEQSNDSNSTSTILVTNETRDSQVYYAIPMEMESEGANASTSTISNGNSQPGYFSALGKGSATEVTYTGDQSEDMDDEYAQFAAEHGHITHENFVSIPNTKGSIIKAEPLQIGTESSSQAGQSIEMLTM